MTRVRLVRLTLLIRSIGEPDSFRNDLLANFADLTVDLYRINTATLSYS